MFTKLYVVKTWCGQRAVSPAAGNPHTTEPTESVLLQGLSHINQRVLITHHVLESPQQEVQLVADSVLSLRNGNRILNLNTVGTWIKLFINGIRVN
jgi:hypothetical protein